MIEAAAEQAFAPAREAVAAGRIPGAALGVVSADGAKSVRVANAKAARPSTAYSASRFRKKVQSP